jgi:hypothetical protein
LAAQATDALALRAGRAESSFRSGPYVKREGGLLKLDLERMRSGVLLSVGVILLCIISYGVYLHFRTAHWNDRLIYAVMKDDVEGIKRALDKGASANAKSEHVELRALDFAVGRANYEVIQVLLQYGATSDDPQTVERAKALLIQEDELSRSPAGEG